MNLCELQLLPLPNGACTVGEGEKKYGILQAGVARLQNPIKKVPLAPAQGAGARVDSQSSAVVRKPCVFLTND